MPSEVARLRQQIETAIEAGKRGLTGLAHVARHRFINKRMQHQADDFQKLVNQVGEEEACKQLFGVIPKEEKSNQGKQIGRKKPSKHESTDFSCI